MKSVMYILAVVAVLANAVRKVLLKRTLAFMLYGKPWNGVSNESLMAMNRNGRMFYIAIKERETERVYPTGWIMFIPYSDLDDVFHYRKKIITWCNENIVGNRLGSAFCTLINYLPADSTDKGKIVADCSIHGFAKKHRLPYGFVFGVVQEFAIGAYQKMQMDGLYPREMFL